MPCKIKLNYVIIFDSNSSMEHYLHDKAKIKAIAIYTFKQLTPPQKN